MKPFTGTLDTYLAGIRGQPDAVLLMADCFSFVTPYGAAAYYTNADFDITLNGNLYSSQQILVDGLKYKCKTGVEVDTQQVTISAHPADIDNQGNDAFQPADLFSALDAFNVSPQGAAFLIALRTLFFDGAIVQRDRVFFSDYLGGTQVGSVTLFKGRIADIIEIGRTTAKINVASDLTFLDLPMPRNLWQSTCLHTLFDSGCTLNEASFSAPGAAGSGCTQTLLNWSGADPKYTQGKIVFSGGTNNGYLRTVKSAVAGQSLTLIYPLPAAPAAGDAFTVYWGCDHTMGTCRSKFNNLANFRAFPFVPPPEMAI